MYFFAIFEELYYFYACKQTTLEQIHIINNKIA